MIAAPAAALAVAAAVAATMKKKPLEAGTAGESVAASSDGVQLRLLAG